MKIAIFDMDGTLIDSKKDITISINYIRDLHYNLKPLSEEFVVEAINMDVRNLPKLFYETEIYEDKDKEVFEVHYAKQCVQNPYLYDGVKDMLEKLVSAGVKISVATNAPTQFAIRMLKSLHVEQLFDYIIGADKVKESKPNPEMLNKILDFYKFNKTTDKAWMIGDNLKDMMSGENAGINTMFVTWGFSPQSEYKTVLRDPNEVLTTIL